MSEIIQIMNLMIEYCVAGLAFFKRLLLYERVDVSNEEHYGFCMAVACSVIELINRILQEQRVDPSADNNCAICQAAINGNLAVVERLLQDKRVDPSADYKYVVRWAAINGHVKVVDLLLEDYRVDPSAFYYAIMWAAENGHVKLVDRLFRVPSVYSTVDLPADQLKHLSMIRSRCTEVCNALQDLGLPALLTLGILDELIPNEIRMWAKWELVTAVKHFHERQEKKRLLLKQ
jgi:ankyrin repeat protein